MDTLIVTGNPAMYALMDELNLVPEGAEVSSHVTPEEVKGMHVVGHLPFSLACHAESITVIPLETRGAHRSSSRMKLSELRYVAGAPRTYTVTEL